MSSVFDDKTAPPDDAALAVQLGRCKTHWDAIVGHIEQSCDGVTLEWKFYGRKHGWQLEAMHHRKALVYLIPHARSFLAGLALDDAAVEAVRASKLAPELIATIVEAARAPEGHPARVEVASKPDADVVRRLIALKLSTRS